MTSYTHPRRRPASEQAKCPSLPDPKSYQQSSSSNIGLSKGKTFHASRLPSSSLDDPLLNIKSIPRRSPTCPQSLEELIAASESRINDVIDSIERCAHSARALQDTFRESLPVPSFFLNLPESDHMTAEKQASAGADMGDGKVDGKDVGVKVNGAAHKHASDSGLGSSISSASRSDAGQAHLAVKDIDSSRKSSVYTPQPSRDGTSTSTAEKNRCLSKQAAQKIKLRIIDPILAEPNLKEYHPFVEGIPERIEKRGITTLRDLEKTLIFLAPSKAKSAASYLNFCETSIQFIVETVPHLAGSDLKRDTDKPYSNNYFLDLIQQVRNYAQIMALSRQKKAQGQNTNKEDHVPGEKVELRGGITEDGSPAELVRVREDGEVIPIDAEKKMLSPIDDLDDTEVDRSGRKRKCDIGKEVSLPCRECGKSFKRPCDLTKHEKTHSRPYKCPNRECKYHILGWPTEKECDRHVSDKHSPNPAMYHCPFENCSYSSKRESNCKQHMEKTHDWTYVRSKSRKGNFSLPAVIKQPSSEQSMTPASAFPSLSTPNTIYTPSPASSPRDDFIMDEDDAPFTNVTMDPSGRLADIDWTNNKANVEALQNSGRFDMMMGFDQMQQSNDLSPQLTNELGGNYGSTFTSSTNFYSPMNSVSDIDLEAPFSFEDVCALPDPAQYFPSYFAQQPTPAASDHGLEFKDPQIGITEFSELNLSNTTDMPDLFSAQQTNTFGTQPAATTETGFTEDFELFGQNDAHISDTQRMFPELSQRPQDGFDGSLDLNTDDIYDAGEQMYAENK